jgi:hypothetical protein
MKDDPVVQSVAGPQGTSDRFESDTPPASPEAGRWKIWLGLCLVSTLSLAAWLALRRRHNAGKIPPAELVAPQGADKQAGDEPVAAAIDFSCSGCGKNLKARAALAGKKVRCPQCGQATPIPSGKGSSVP